VASVRVRDRRGGAFSATKTLLIPQTCGSLIAAATVILLAGDRPARAQSQDELFADGSLQEVRLVVNSRDWQELKEKADENTYYPANLIWKGITVRNVGIRSRGSGTRNGTKPGLRVDVNRYLSNQEFVGLKALILDNAYTDATTIRESISMKLFNRLGVPAPREAHARLYVNNEYVGAYVIVESVDRTFVQRVFGVSEGAVESGGYLFEYKWLFPYYFEYLGPDLDAYAPLFRPQTRETDSIAAIFAPIEGMIRAINEAPDEDFAAAVGEYLDLRLFMKQVAIENFLVDWDGITGNWATNNFYLYRFRESTRSQFIPWDKDNTFTFIDVPVNFRMDLNVLTRRALMVPELRQVYYDTLAECANVAIEQDSGDSRGWLEREVDREADQVAAAVAEDPVFPFSYDRFQDEVAFLRQFARERPPFVSCEVANAEDPSGEQRSCSAALNESSSMRRTVRSRSGTTRDTQSPSYIQSTPFIGR
jgi:CotH kinase protein